MIGDTEFREERRRGIGGSDWRHILNLEYGCIRRAWYEKRAVEPDFEVPEAEGPMLRGSKLEPLVCSEAEERLGIKLRRQTRFRRAPWLPAWWIGNVDRMVVGGGGFEAKTKGPWVFRSLMQAGVPQAELAQMQHYMALAGRETWLYACLEPVSWQFYFTEIRRDPDMIQQMLVAGERFWRLVTEGPAPERPYLPTDSICRKCPWRWTCHGEALFSVAPAGVETGEVPTVTDEGMVTLVREAYELRDIVAQAESRLEQIKGAVQAFLGEPKKVRIDGKLVSWLEFKESRFQTAEFKQAHPELAEKFTKPQTKRVFRWE
jgi:predicted phage-related endonuclease